MGKLTCDDDLLEKGFVQVPILVLQDPDLGAGAKLTYGLLLWYLWKGEDYPGHHEAAKDFGLSRASLCRYLSELGQRGLIQSMRPGLGETNSYHLPDPRLTLRPLGSHIETSDVSSCDAHKDKTSLHTLKTNTKDTSLSSQSLHHNKTALIATITSEFAPNEPQQAIQTYLARFPVALITRAAEITRANSHATNPIAYLYGVIQRLQEQEATQPVAHQHVEQEPELTEEEYQVSLQALERVKQQLSQQGQ